MKAYYFLAIVLLLSATGYSNEPSYPVTAIPQQLLKNADVVKRMEEMKFEIISAGETVLHEKYAFTILNENGAEHASFSEWYDQLRSISYIEGSLYDAAGKLVRKLKSKDIQDVSNVGDNLMDDSRMKLHNFNYNTYPYTVEYEVEMKFNHTFYFPAWLAQDFEKQSVEKSRFIFIAPKDYELHYKSFNYKGEPVITNEKNKKVFVWEVNNTPSVIRQFAAPDWKELTPVVYTSPSSFELQGYKGKMDSWKDLGAFQWELNKGRDVLPQEVVQKAQQLTEGLKTDKEKVKALYQYLQQTTRYISIQLGIGGWQPFDAASVAAKGYGDCKALSNYMCSLLKAINIKAYYTLVYAGANRNSKRAVMEDFPARNFNHVIVCVPLPKDTMWLECTSQTMPAGYMSDFTGNRKALLITEEGGVLVSTPGYGLKENIQIRSVKGAVNDEGDLTVNVNTVYSGTLQDDLHGMLNYLSKDKVKKVLNEELNLSTYDINGFKYEEKKNSIPEIEEQLDIWVSRYATISGKRLFIAPNLLNRNSRQLTVEENRSYDYVFDTEYKNTDTAEIEIPAGYTLEAAGQDVTLKTKFGSYSSSVKLVNNHLFYLRKQEQYAGRYPAPDKEEMAKYLDTIYKADRSRVVLVKNQVAGN
jgi:transglutaminase-like putative cysteine protease